MTPVSLGVTFDAKMTYEKQLRSVSIAATLEAWYHQKVLASISGSVTPEIFLKLSTAGLGVLFRTVVLSCRFTPQTTGQSCQER